MPLLPPISLRFYARYAFDDIDVDFHITMPTPPYTHSYAMLLRATRVFMQPLHIT